MQKTFEVQGPVELDVRLASGDIEVDPTAEGRVEVELIAHDEESQRLVDDARIELSPHGHRPTILVDVPQKRGFGSRPLRPQRHRVPHPLPARLGAVGPHEVGRHLRARHARRPERRRQRPATSTSTVSPAASTSRARAPTSAHARSAAA